MMKLLSTVLLVFLSLQYSSKANSELDDTGQCTLENACDEPADEVEAPSKKYKKDYNEIFQKIEEALRSYKPCAKEVGDPGCDCHADVIARDLEPYQKTGVIKKTIEDSAKYGTRYKILNHRLYRDAECMFPTRCSGIEYFVRQLLPDLPDMDLVMNTRDWPQLRTNFGAKGPVFSFSKTREYRDVMYPAWSFWAGGPAISLHPTGIGRWDLFRESISKEAAQTPWPEKNTLAFFRGSRTSDERDSLVLLSRRSPNLVDAQYTKNQAWKSPKDTLNAEPAKEVSFEHHCLYKYLFNFRGVAASFRLKHLFLCKSLVFHVGEEWNEFFYFALKPWVHYVPLKSYPSQQDIEQMLLFFREHDDLAKEIANRGYEFIWQHLRMEDVECYWKNLLLKYQKLLLYNVTEDATLIEVKARY